MYIVVGKELKFVSLGNGEEVIICGIEGIELRIRRSGNVYEVEEKRMEVVE